jgi:hypothetical protein
MPREGILTLALGAKYAAQAQYLALSCVLNSPHTLRAVITDRPETLTPYYDLVIPCREEFGHPFRVKTRLNRYTPFENTLYIDADSLVFHPLDSLFTALNGRGFVYNGGKRTEGTWYLDIGTLITRLGVPWLPEFNSGMLLFNREQSAAVFEDASAYMTNYAESEIAFFRGTMLPDEPFLAMALAKNNVEPYEDFGRFSRTLIGASRIRLNAAHGFALYTKEGVPVFPLIVHFCGRWGNCLYALEKIRLRRLFNPPVRTILLGFLTFLRKLLKRDGV